MKYERLLDQLKCLYIWLYIKIGHQQEEGVWDNSYISCVYVAITIRSNYNLFISKLWIHEA